MLTIHQIYILVYLTVKHQKTRYRMVVPFLMKWVNYQSGIQGRTARSWIDRSMGPYYYWYVEELSSIDRAVKMSKSTEMVTEWLNMVLMNTALDLFSLLSEYDVFKAGITF